MFFVINAEEKADVKKISGKNVLVLEIKKDIPARTKKRNKNIVLKKSLFILKICMFFVFFYCAIIENKSKVNFKFKLDNK